MSRRFVFTRGLLGIGALLTLVVAIACAADEPAQPAQPAAPLPAAPAAEAAFPTDSAAPAPAPAAQQLPASAAPARPAALPAAAAAPTGAAGAAPAAAQRKGADPSAAMEEFKYVAPEIAPGDYPSHKWDGPTPTNLKESPMSAALVKSGDIPPVEDRLPVLDDIWVIAPYDEIGAYGGTLRITTHHIKTLDHIAVTSLVNGDPKGISEPRIIKDFHISDDGRVYTFTLRRGARWSDGYPMTIEDIRFAMEDLMFDQGEINTRIATEFFSQITGNPAKFKVVDDVTYTVTYDDPYYDLAASRGIWGWSKTRGCPRCMYAPSHIYKRFHPKYNAEEIPALLKEYDKKDPMSLFGFMRNIRSGPGLDWRKKGDVPTTADPNFIYKGDYYIPTMAELVQTDCCEGGRGAVRNHFFIAVDPEGNQLPYQDGQRLFKLESREAAAFRGMNGENDYYGGSMVLSEMPLYIANMQKGDYSVYIFRSPAGTDSSTVLQQEYVEDEEIGRLLRTKDFRKALSIGADRNSMNETVASGIGTPQQWIPHPSTPYFPGQQWADLDTEYDLEAAKALMAKMGYEDKNGDGFLDRKDGSGNLSMHYAGSAVYFPHIQSLQDFWGRVGIKLTIEEGSNSRKNNVPNPTRYLDHAASLYSANQWTVQWTRAFVGTGSSGHGAEMGDYWSSFGKSGMAPSGPDPTYQDVYGNMAPSGTYPADMTGNVKRLQDIWRTGIQTGTLFDPKRVELGKEFWRINAEEKYTIGWLAFMGLFRGMSMVRNNVRNVPKNHVTLEAKGILGAYYFEDGIDNLNNPGNRSKKYKSVHFLDPEYWTQ